MGNPIEKFTNFEFVILIWYEYLAYILGSVFCVCFAGGMSGLTLGLLSFDTMTLEILSSTGTKLEKKRAKKIYKLVKHHHWLLVTLLLCNALAMDELVPSTVAILVSVTAILFAGEVIPQALCSRFGLAIGYYAFWIVFVLMWFTAPISWPISKLLDWLLGKNHATFFRRAQLKELVALHGEEGGAKKGPLGEGPLTPDEINVIRGALDLSSKNVASIMTYKNNVYMLDINRKLDMKTMKELENQGHSRVPVFDSELVSLSPDDEMPIRSLFEQKKIRKIPAVQEDFPIWDLLNIFQQGKAHMAVVYSQSPELDNADPKSPNKRSKVVYDVNNLGEGKIVIGIVTLEDVIEELIQEEIIDETDVYVDLNTHLKVADMFRRISLFAIKRTKSRENIFGSYAAGDEDRAVMEIPVNKEESLHKKVLKKNFQSSKKGKKEIEMKEMNVTFKEKVPKEKEIIED